MNFRGRLNLPGIGYNSIAIKRFRTELNVGGESPKAVMGTKAEGRVLRKALSQL